MIQALALALTALLFYGMTANGLWTQAHWTQAGLVRLGTFAAVSVAVGIPLVLFRRPWMFICVGASGFLYASAAVGPLPVLAAAWFLASCWALGRVLAAEWKDPVVAVSLGLAAWVVVFSLVARFPLHHAALWWGLTALPFPLALWRRAGWPEWTLFELDRRESLALVLLLAGLAANFLLALGPEVNADALTQHLVVGERLRVFHHWNFDISEFTWAAMPLGGDWTFSIAYLLGGEHAARLFNFACMAALAGVLVRILESFVTRAEALCVAAVFVSCPITGLVTGSLFVENVWALLVLAAFQVTSLARENRRRAAAWMVALLAGAAAQTKLLAIPLAGVIVLHSLWRSRTLLPALLAAACAAPPYLEALLRTGNPFFPYFNRWFRSPQFSTASIVMDTRYQQGLSWRTLWDATLHTDRFMECRPGGFGFQWLIFLPASILSTARGMRGPALFALLLGLGHTIAVFLGQGYLRYLYADLALWTVAMGAVVAKRRILLALAAALVPLNLYFLSASGWYHQDFFVNQVFDRAAETRYLEESAPLRALSGAANRLHPGAPVAFFGKNEVYPLWGRAWETSWHNLAFRDACARAASADDILRLLRERGIALWIAPAPASEQFDGSLVLWMFARQHGRVIERSGDWALYALAENANAIERGAPGAGVYDEMNPGSTFDGPWLRGTQFPAALRRSVCYCATGACRMSFDFEGGGVDLIYTAAFNRGVADLAIDGVSAGVLDQYSENVRWQSRHPIRGLSPGRHRLTIVVTGRRRAESCEANVDVDGFEVYPR